MHVHTNTKLLNTCMGATMCEEKKCENNMFSSIKTWQRIYHWNETSFISWTRVTLFSFHSSLSQESHTNSIYQKIDPLSYTQVYPPWFCASEQTEIKCKKSSCHHHHVNNRVNLQEDITNTITFNNSENKNDFNHVVTTIIYEPLLWRLPFSTHATHDANQNPSIRITTKSNFSHEP